MTAANHGWDNTSLEVVHGGKAIGMITERRPERDWAFFELNKGVDFTNSEYFDGPVPRNLIGCGDVSLNVTPYSYFGCDGFTTGMVWLLFSGLLFRKGKGMIQQMTSSMAYIMRRLRGTQDELARIPHQGLCGATLKRGRRVADFL
jgi:hypothetical protein